MMKNKRELITITDQVKAQIADVDVAPPLLYKKLFYNLLAAHDIACENEELIVDQIFDEKLSKLKTLSDNTSKNVVKLDNTTKDAMDAIKKGDGVKLERVLEETANLRIEIEKLKASIFTDTLTKAYNRQWLYSNYMDGAEVFTSKGILVFIDMNYFKDINDNYGHIAGDKVLEFTAMHLKKTKGELVRYGGDEFLLLFGNQFSVDQIKSLISNNRALITRKELKFKENSFHTSYSYGIAPFDVNDNFQDVLSVADTSMYEDKEEFKHRLIIG
ncbi:MAG: GGDEF domain-containing protein [Thiovulaceae bacterium]|nr:GGDEF domain-containing protein [Sulfurimonadaceae bacterium]